MGVAHAAFACVVTEVRLGPDILKHFSDVFNIRKKTLDSKRLISFLRFWKDSHKMTPNESSDYASYWWILLNTQYGLSKTAGLSV